MQPTTPGLLRPCSSTPPRPPYTRQRYNGHPGLLGWRRPCAAMKHGQGCEGAGLATTTMATCRRVPPRPALHLGSWGAARERASDAAELLSLRQGCEARDKELVAKKGERLTGEGNQTVLIAPIGWLRGNRTKFWPAGRPAPSSGLPTSGYLTTRELIGNTTILDPGLQSPN